MPNVCEDCYLTVAGYSEEEIGHKPDRPVMALLPGIYAPGGREAHDPFSKQPCEGCGSTLAGARHEVVMVHVLGWNVSSRLGTPHDCGLCDGRIVLDGADEEGRTLWVCVDCGWRHTSKDCCEVMVHVGMPDITPDRGPYCSAQDPDTGAVCTMQPPVTKHVHIAGDGVEVVAVWREED